MVKQILREGGIVNFFVLCTFFSPQTFTQASLSSLESHDSVRLVAAIGCVLSSMSVKDLVGPLETLVGSRVESIQVSRGNNHNLSCYSTIVCELLGLSHKLLMRMLQYVIQK